MQMQISEDDQKQGSQLPETVKIDLDTPLESFWSVMTFFSVIACLVILWIGYIGGEDTPPEPEFLRFLPWALGASAFFLILRYFTNNFYLAVRHREAIFYHFEFAFIRSVREYLKFSDVDSVIVNGTAYNSDGSSWYQYQIQLIDRTGQAHYFSDSMKEPRLELLNTRAEAISRIIGCRLFPGTSEHTHTVTANGGHVFISTSHKPLQNADSEGISTKFSTFTARAFLVVEILVVFLSILFFILK